MTPSQAKALRTLREEIERMESERGSDVDGIIERLDHARSRGMGNIQHPMQRRPIFEALAYRRPFPDWTPAVFVSIVGADPAERHPYTACMGFRELWPPFKRAEDREPVRDAQIQQDAKTWLIWLLDNNEQELARQFSLLMLSDEDLGELERRLDI
jgi:hypothetical protein